MRLGRVWGLLLCTLPLVSCLGTSQEDTRSVLLESPEPLRKKAPAPKRERAPMSRPSSLQLGTASFAGSEIVVDADTLRVPSIPNALKLFGVDCEDIFGAVADRQAAQSDFLSYAKRQQAKTLIPGSYATPLGEEAQEFAEELFQFGGELRIEFDDVQRSTDYEGRPLVHVFLINQGREIHYNEELIRRGYSPYVKKQGLSSRYDAVFQKAEEEARQKQLGIWDPNKQHYLDYETRIEWWERRALANALFEARHGKDPNFIRLDDDDALERLRAKEGKRVTIFGEARESQESKKPYKLLLSHRRGDDFWLISFDKTLWLTLEADKLLGEYLYVEGVVVMFYGTPEIRLEDEAKVYQEDQ